MCVRKAMEAPSMLRLIHSGLGEDVATAVALARMLPTY